MVIFKCPHCGAKLGIDDEHAGKNIDCPKCQAKSTVPAQDAAAAPVDKAAVLNAKTQLAPLPGDTADILAQKTQLAPPEAMIKTQLAPSPSAQSPTIPERLKKTQLAPPPFTSGTPVERPHSRSHLMWAAAAGGLFVLSICILALAVGVVLWNQKGSEPIAKGKTDGNSKEIVSKEKPNDPLKSDPNGFIKKDDPKKTDLEPPLNGGKKNDDNDGKIAPKTGPVAPKIDDKKEKITQPKKGDIIVNSLGMKLVYVPPGKFLMGSPPGELEREPFGKGSELQHEVTLTNGFYLGAYAVTQEEYQTVMGSNPSYFSAQGNGKEKVAGLDTRRFPVETVSWGDATEFCRKLSQKEGKTYRLPTEAEWEYACRAGTTTPFHFGETISTDQANYNGNSVYGNGVKGVYRARPMPVGSFPANAWGLHDMHGNVWQWCEDWYDAGYYQNSPKINPVNKTTGQYRVLRGGSWDVNPRLCRSALRLDLTPDVRGNFLGFRALLSSP